MNSLHIIFLILTVCSVSASPQYGSMEFTSNWFAANWPRWRAVNGAVMNAEFSNQFVDIGGGLCTWRGSNGSVLVVQIRQVDIYRTVKEEHYSYLGSIGAFGGSGPSYRREKIGEKTVITKWGMTNYSGAIMGATVRGTGTPQDKRVLNGQEVMIYDFGTRPTQEEIDVLKARLELQTKQNAKPAKPKR